MPDNPVILYHYGKVLHQAGYEAKSRMYLKKAVELSNGLEWEKDARSILNENHSG
jgi:hypothetical protein